MKYVRSLNNNAAVVIDDMGKDAVIFGRGISFGLKKGDDVPSGIVERIFLEKDATSLEKLLEDIPQSYFNLVCEIIEYIQGNMNISISNSLYIGLMDHISFIKERAEKGMMPQNPLKWEIRRYYQKEFQLAQKIVSLLEEELDCELNDDEAASITLHIVNAENDFGYMRETMENVRLLDDILQIICFQAGVEPEEGELDYQRLVTHVKFFIQRVHQKKEYKVNEELYQMVKKTYPKAYAIADKVKGFVEKKLGCQINHEEVTYLAVHTQRILKKTDGS